MSTLSTAEPTGTPFKHSVPFSAAVNAALLKAAAAARMEPTEIIQRATIRYLIDNQLIEKAEGERQELFWELVDRTVAAAQHLCRTGRFASSITLDAIEYCMNDPVPLKSGHTWTEGYRIYVKDDIFKNGNPEKGPINREIGFRIRAGIDGEVAKDEQGKSISVKVLGKTIQSYSKMADYDRVAFGR